MTVSQCHCVKEGKDINIDKCLLPEVISLLPYLLYTNALCNSTYFMYMYYIIHYMTAVEDLTNVRMLREDIST